jgi:hypothetical protein
MSKKPKASIAAPSKTAPKKGFAEAPSAFAAADPNKPNVVSGWEDDPEPAVATERPIPDLNKTPLAFSFDQDQPAPGVYPHGTPEFRYWSAAEALRRGADFWAQFVPTRQWQMGSTLKVIMDEGEDLNAFYDRQALNFFHGPGQDGVVFSGESPDIVCHEMGHAILDSIKPQLWDVAASEPPAFHEAFADISAILSALQLQSLRVAILKETNGRLFRNSRLSRLAEQLGTAIRLQFPDAVDADCLRNAVNSFTYQDPTTLPSATPASQISSEPHSFSRVFSGAVFEIMGGMLSRKAAAPDSPTEAELLAVSKEIAQILVEGVKQAPVVPNWYAQVAAGMVTASGDVNAAYPPILKAAFVRRSILSMESASSVQALQMSVAAAGVTALADPASAPLADMALPASDYGLDQPLLVGAASHPRRIVARSAAVQTNGSTEPASSSTAARAFVEDLFSRGRVHYGEFAEGDAHYDHGRRLRTHELVKEKGAIRLRRRLFDCGIAH